MLWSANNERTKNQKTNRTMKKYIRSVVLICALNGVGVWADNSCATRIISPEFGPWPSRPSFLIGPNIIPTSTYCLRTRNDQFCAGPNGAAGWTGYYCQDGPKRHHTERTVDSVLTVHQPCPHARKEIVKLGDRPTKRLSNNPCSDYSPGFVWPSFQ